MMFTILGYNQQRLLELGFDTTDAIILYWFSQFVHSGRMNRIPYKGYTYYWLNYQYILEEIPIIHIKTRIAIQRRFARYVHQGIMQKCLHHGNMVCFRLTAKYYTLLSPSQKTISKPENSYEYEETQEGGKPESIAPKPESIPSTEHISDRQNSNKQGETQEGGKPESIAPKPESIGGYTSKYRGGKLESIGINSNTIDSNTTIQKKEKKETKKRKTPSPPLSNNPEYLHLGDFQNIHLTPRQYALYVTWCGNNESKAQWYLERLSEKLEKTGKTYRNYYATLREYINQGWLAPYPEKGNGTAARTSGYETNSDRNLRYIDAFLHRTTDHQQEDHLV